MNSNIDGQMHAISLKFRNASLEDAYGGWDFDRLKGAFLGATWGSGGLMTAMTLLAFYVLGRFDWLVFWAYFVSSWLLSLAFHAMVRYGNVKNRSDLDLYGTTFVSLGQIAQFLVATVHVELRGEYQMAIVILSIMGNSNFNSINVRYIIPILCGIMVTYICKVTWVDGMEGAQWSFHVAIVVMLTVIGATAGHIMEYRARTNYLIQSALERQRHELMQKNKELEQFAYIASHDLQEPLRSVTSFSELLNEDYRDQVGPEGGKYLDYLLEASGRMRNLIRDLLDYSRLGREAQLQLVDVGTILGQVKQDLRVSIEESGAQVSVGPMPQLQVYETEFRQLVQNLLSNALKFRNRDVAPHIRVTAQRLGNEWEFSVKDNGIGIDPAHQDRIFLIFQRLHTRNQYEGTGIGLANCRKIVELHGGTIRVESEQGRGSNFIFTIPITRA